MSVAARASIVAGLALLAMAHAPLVRAAGDTIDDPKMARRLGSRVSTAGAGDAAATPSPATATPAAPSPVSPLPRAASSASATATLASADGARTSDATTSGDLVATAGGRPASPPGASAGGPAGHTPLVGLGYRRFSFVQVGATDAGSATGAAVSEPFDSLSLDFYPISRTIRFGLSTQYGWQGGRFSSGGDYFIAQSASLGVQAPGTVVTPFAEAFAGGGYLRRTQFDRTIPTAYWQFGLDAGASFFVADHGYFSVALGYLRPVNGFLKMQSFTSVYVDTWSLKIGFGI